MSEKEFEKTFEKAVTAASTPIGLHDIVSTRWGNARVMNIGPKNYRIEVVEGGAIGMRLTTPKDSVVFVKKGESVKKQLDKEHQRLVREIYKHTDPDNRLFTGGQHQVRDRRKGRDKPIFSRPNLVLENMSKDDLRAYAKDEGIIIGAAGKTAKLPPEEKLRRIREIVSGHQHNMIEGVTLDAFSASAIVAVYDKLSPENQPKFLSLPIPKMASFAFKMIK